MDEDTILIDGGSGDILGTARGILGDVLGFEIQRRNADAAGRTVLGPLGGSYVIGADGRLYSAAGSGDSLGIGSSVGPLIVMAGLALIGYAIYKAVK